MFHKMFPYIDTVATGERINAMRNEKGVSIKEMQKWFFFTTPAAIYKWIHGETLPAVDNLVVLAIMFGVKVDDILVVRGGENFKKMLEETEETI